MVNKTREKAEKPGETDKPGKAGEVKLFSIYINLQAQSYLLLSEVLILPYL